MLFLDLILFFQYQINDLKVFLALKILDFFTIAVYLSKSILNSITVFEFTLKLLLS